MYLPVLPKEPPEGVEIHHNCARCMALCCNYVSREIDPPTTRRDYDNLRWYLMHPGVRVYLDDEGCWFLQLMSRCSNLGEDNLCQVYEERPQICRELQPNECEFARGPGDQHCFTCLEEFDRWHEERERRRRERSRKLMAARAATRQATNRNGRRSRS
jgi:Fe-S-cluster containining protein